MWFFARFFLFWGLEGAWIGVIGICVKFLDHYTREVR